MADEQAAGPSSTVHIGVVRWAGAERNAGNLYRHDDSTGHQPAHHMPSPTRALAFPTPSRTLDTQECDAPSPTSGVRWAVDGASQPQVEPAPAAPRPVPVRYTWLRTDTPLK